MSSPEYGGDAVVQRGAVRVEEAAVGAGVARHGRQRFSGDAAEARLRKGNGVAAGDADDGDSAGGVGCGNGCNGICGRHKTVSFPVSLNSPSSLSHFPRKSKIPPFVICFCDFVGTRRAVSVDFARQKDEEYKEVGGEAARRGRFRYKIKTQDKENAVLEPLSQCCRTASSY